MRPSRLALLNLAVLIAIMTITSQGWAQLVGDDLAAGSSCATYPAGATTVTADADLDGANVVLVCDGTTWNAMAGGEESLWYASTNGIYHNDGFVGVGTELPTATLDVRGSFAVSGTLTPSALTSDTNDYAPSGLEDVAVLRLSANGPYALTGLAGGVQGRLITIMNVGSDAIALRDEDPSSTAANRFALGGADILLKEDQVLTLIYDSEGIDRWRALSVPGGSASMPICPIGDVLAYTASGWTCSSEVAPDVFDFVDTTGLELSKVASSNIIQLTGLVGTQSISIAGEGSPEYRTCANATCGSVITNWTSGAGTVENNNYVQVRLTTSSSGSTARVATLTVGTESADWSATTTALTSISFVASAVSTGASATIPASAQTGDIAVLFDHAYDSQSGCTSSCTPSTSSVVPSGWTSLANDNWGVSTNCGSSCYNGYAARLIVSYRVLTAGQAGTSVTGMNEDAEDKVMLVFRPNAAISNANATLWNLADSNSTPASQSLAASGVGGVVLGFGVTAKQSSTANLTGSTPAFDATVLNGDSDIIAGYKIYNSNPADHTIATTTTGSTQQRTFLGRGVIKVW